MQEFILLIIVYGVVKMAESISNCTQCQKKVNGSEELKMHMMIHGGEKLNVCKECGKSFTFAKHLKTHIFKYCVVKNAGSISNCQKKVKGTEALKRHMVLHDGNKLYVCKECGKSFALSKYLKNHIVRHTGEKQHKCSEWGRSFFEAAHLRSHMTIHTSEKSISCKPCLYFCKTNSALANHVITNHSGEKTHMCEV